MAPLALMLRTAGNVNAGVEPTFSHGFSTMFDRGGIDRPGLFRWLLKLQPLRERALRSWTSEEVFSGIVRRIRSTCSDCDFRLSTLADPGGNFSRSIVAELV